MNNRSFARCVTVALLLAALGGATSTPPAMSAARGAVSVGAVVAAVASQAAAPTEEFAAAPMAASTPTPPSKTRLARFDEAAGLFSVRYPRDFRRIERLASSSDAYGYAFTTDDASAALAVGFMVMSDSPMTDGEWTASRIVSVLGPETLIKGLGEIFSAEFVEVKREEGETGTHTLYWEGEYAGDGSSEYHLRSGLRVEESEGVLGLIAVVAPSDQWAEREPLFLESLDSLVWSPAAAREQIPPPGTSEDEGAATEVVPDGVIELSPEGSQTPGSMDIIERDEIPVSEETPQAIETPGVDATVEPDATLAVSDTVTFEDPDGVFSWSYPAEFDNADGPSLSDGNYVYAVWIGDGSRYLAVTLSSLAEEALSDEQWDTAVDPMVQSAKDNFANDATEKFRSMGDPGVHWVYVEVDSKSVGARAFYYMGEAEGVLAMVFGQVPRDEWADWEDRMVTAVNSFTWSPEAARKSLGSEQSTQPEPTARPKSKATPPPPTARPKATETGLPAGKGGLVMLNCRSDVVTVDVLPDAIFQELAPRSGEECHRGDPIFLKPGDHILKASIAGVPSQGESTVTIEEGQWLEFTWS